ncbi:MAG TPA: ABC transporter permease [Actinomycetota bacterium]|nr:ABC transporter permease [Actinomycetota bacterium]
MRARLRELAAYREILINLVRKELKVKYTASVLGTIWSLLNPVVFLAVFWFVSKILRGGVQDYPVFLLSGLLAWNLFSVAISSGAQSVIVNANLVKKVYFPREILPLAAVGVALVDFVLQSAVFFALLLVFTYGFALDFLWLYPLAFVALIVLGTGIAFLVSALNVRYRDVQHLIGLGLIVWFWLTPIVYAPGTVADVLVERSQVYWNLYLLNPVAWVVMGFQGALYHSPDAAEVLAPISDRGLAAGLGTVILLGMLFLYLTWRLYFTRSGDFAEEL